MAISVVVISAGTATSRIECSAMTQLSERIESKTLVAQATIWKASKHSTAWGAPSATTAWIHSAAASIPCRRVG